MNAYIEKKLISSWRQRLLTMLAGAILLILISYLLYFNYRSQVELQGNALDQMLNKTHVNALAVEYFFSERMNDMKTIVENRTLSVYFENAALGMSMTYGLRSSLQAISRDLQHVVEDRKIGKSRIYQRIEFIGTNGQILVDSTLDSSSGSADFPTFDYEEEPEKSDPYVNTVIKNNTLYMQIVAPYWFKGRYCGKIVGWITPELVEQHLLRNDCNSNRFSGLISPKGGMSIALHDLAPPHYFSELPDFTQFELEQPKLFVATNAKKQKVKVIVVGEHLKTCDLTLVQVIPVSEVLGSGSPTQLAVAMCMLSLLIVGGAAMALRSNTRRIVLLARLDEAAQQKKDVEQVNERLQNEITAKRRIEQQLQVAHDELEERVQQRTKELLTLNRELEQEIVERRRLEAELVHAQKLESVGQLAAGIAHEINTPTQFVSDNTRFIQKVFPKIALQVDRCRSFMNTCTAGTVPQEMLADTVEFISQNKLDSLMAQIPEALNDSLEGLQRIADIVRAMKDFSHPDQNDFRLADLNRAIESTITVARSEWKQVAEVVLDLDSSLPLVSCVLSDFNQVILNLVINSAHAISEGLSQGKNEKGKIEISTRCSGKNIEIRVRDNGSGIPEEYRDRVFDHFFTTKEVGKGTGQGLSLAHSIITEKHKGAISFESKSGVGTTFTIMLPIESSSSTTPGGVL